jgi:hypothetical protein
MELGVGLGAAGVKPAQTACARSLGRGGVNRSLLRHVVAERLGITMIDGGENLSVKARAVLGGREADVVFEASRVARTVRRHRSHGRSL